MKNNFLQNNLLIFKLSSFSTKKGFTLAEMMMVMFVLGILTVAFLPVITTRIKVSSGNSVATELWQYASNGTDLYYGTGSNQGVVIGTNSMGSEKTKLLINTPDSAYSHVLLQQYGPNVGQLTVNSAGNLILGNPTVTGSKCTAIGQTPADLSYHTIANGTGCTVVGCGGAQAVGDYSSAFGYNANAYGASSVAFGAASKAVAASCAFGYYATATGVGSTAIGDHSTASGSSSLAIGGPTYNSTDYTGLSTGASAAGGYSTAIGASAQANASCATAIGARAQANASYATAIGGYDGTNFAYAYTGSTAVGNGAQAKGIYSIAAGISSRVTAQYGIAIGNGAWVSALIDSSGSAVYDPSIDYYGIAIGYSASATGPGSLAIGQSATGGTDGNNHIAIGIRAFAAGISGSPGDGCIAIGGLYSGNPASADGKSCVAIGHAANTHSGNRHTAIGYRARSLNSSTCCGSIGTGDGTANHIDGFGNLAHYGIGSGAKWGYGANADASATTGGYPLNGVAVGYGSKATGACAVAFGGYNASLTYPSAQAGLYGTAIGTGAYASSASGNCTAVGYNAQASADYSAAIGYNAASSTSNTIVLGTVNEAVQVPGQLWVKTNQITMNSDRRLKNIQGPFRAGLNEINKINVYNYTFKSDKKKIPCVGVIAQELQKVFPNAVAKGPDGYLGIRQNDMFYAMINAIKQLDIKVQKLVQEFRALSAKVQMLDDRLTVLIKVNKMNSQKLQAVEKRNNELQKRHKMLKNHLAKLDKQHNVK